MVYNLDTEITHTIVSSGVTTRFPTCSMVIVLSSPGGTTMMFRMTSTRNCFHRPVVIKFTNQYKRRVLFMLTWLLLQVLLVPYDLEHHIVPVDYADDGED